MRTILSMFAKSPFKPLVSHIEKVNECVNQIKPLFDAFLSSDYEKVESIAKQISKVEYKADKIKDDIDTSFTPSNTSQSERSLTISIPKLE